jgi:APA family basic amino acid/polyamine antiporter
VFTGMVPFDELTRRLATEQAEPLTMAIGRVAPGAAWASAIVGFGAVVANTAVLLVFQMGQPRIFFSMARDGLLPPGFAKVHPRFQTPHVTTILTGVVVGGISAVASIDEMVDLTNIGTLFAFVLVCVGIPILRAKDPERVRPFRVPFGPYVIPVLGALACVGLMVYLPPASWWRFVGWLTLGLAVYASYGHNHSTLGRGAGRPEQTPASQKVMAVALLVAASGLFAMPHGGVVELARAVVSAEHSRHARALTGVLLVVMGVAGAALAALAALVRRRQAVQAVSSRS